VPGPPRSSIHRAASSLVTRHARKIIPDPVHRLLEIPEFLLGIINTRIFARLRNLNQTSGLVAVYPAATHTRAEHSLGVAHLATQLLDILAKTDPIDPRDALCVQIAALIHDLGHGPCSHMFDGVLLPSLGEHTWSHEHGTVMLFQHLVTTTPLPWHAHGIDEAAVHLICELVLGKPSHAPPGWRWRGPPPGKEWMMDIVSNARGFLDVDRVDYIARDSNRAGMPGFDSTGVILNAARILTTDGQTRIGFNIKVKDHIARLLSTRNSLHRTGYQHRVSHAYEEMLVELMRLGDPWAQWLQCIRAPETYIPCTDVMINMLLYGQAWKEPILQDRREAIERLTKRIHERNFYVMVSQTFLDEHWSRITGMEPRSDTVREWVCHLAHTKLPTDHPQRSAFLDVSSPLWTVRLAVFDFGAGDANPLASVLFFTEDKDGVVVPRFLNEEEAGLFTLHRNRDTMVRIFCTSEEETVQAQMAEACELMLGPCRE